MDKENICIVTFLMEIQWEVGSLMQAPVADMSQIENVASLLPYHFRCGLIQVYQIHVFNVREISNRIQPTKIS